MICEIIQSKLARALDEPYLSPSTRTLQDGASGKAGASWKPSENSGNDVDSAVSKQLLFSARIDELRAPSVKSNRHVVAAHLVGLDYVAVLVGEHLGDGDVDSERDDGDGDSVAH